MFAYGQPGSLAEVDVNVGRRVAIIFFQTLRLCFLFFNLSLFREQVASNLEVEASEIELQYGIRTLQSEEFLADCGIEDEGECSVHMSLDGGKRKRKKKVHTTPKRIPHKHLKRPKALLDYFNVDDASGKVKRLKQESTQAAGAYMADHPDRYTCGKTGTMFYKLTADGKRLPAPKQNKVAKVVEVVKKAAPAKKKKK